MIYPKFLTPGSKVGICAPSAGIDAEDHAGFDRSLGHLKARGWQITETASVRAGGIESAPGPVIMGAFALGAIIFRLPRKYS